MKLSRFLQEIYIDTKCNVTGNHLASLAKKVTPWPFSASFITHYASFRTLLGQYQPFMGLFLLTLILFLLKIVNFPS